MDRSTATYPQRIRTDGSNPFARHTMTVRLPAVLREIVETNPDYPPRIVGALSVLEAELLENRPMKPVEPPLPDEESGGWESLPAGGERWLDSEWFSAEHLFYRRIVEAVRWWETGRDPFAPVKRRELEGEGIRRLLHAAAGASGSAADPAERLSALLAFDLWGNRIDLSYKESSALGATGVDARHLVADAREQIVARLLDRDASEAAVHIVTDNAGSELAADLLLADALVRLGFAVWLHVKFHPTYVSDAVAADVLALIGGLEREKQTATAASRLAAAFDGGALRIAPDLYWNSSRFIGELPRRLARQFDGARLVIFKGDVNYRRLTGDALWRPDAPFAEVVGRFPAPAALLRTMKSDTVFGLPAGLAEGLEREQGDWRSAGRHGLIQYFP